MRSETRFIDIYRFLATVFMVEIEKGELLKNSPDYEDYSENIWNLSIEELRKEGLLQCGGCCSKNNNGKSKCDGCKKKEQCKK